MILGAFLTQNASWHNASLAISNLKKKGMISVSRLSRVPARSLAQVIRPAGYFNVKAARIRNFALFLNREYGSLKNLFREKTPLLRTRLLQVNGVGPETADSILLYAAKRPVFVIDAYTRRIFSRLGLVPGDASYEQIQAFFMDPLPADRRLFNEYHALLVRLAKTHCLASKPRCYSCPILALCRYGKH
ncbi:MAG: endonuclease III domain-containing protein [Candidatus Omnitrophica bacterium]|nr:endonuclease III domain-containing protein [Candidatus Omnitrophota bacterium]